MDARIHSRSKDLFHFRRAFLSLIIFLSLCLYSCDASSGLPAGHLKPFGCCNPVKEGVDVVEGWPHPVTFFKEYAIPRKPVLLKNAAKVSPAYKLWTDEYLSNLDLPSDAKVKVETGKKQNIIGGAELMDFKEWIRQYNHANGSDKYMVTEMPAYLGKDIVLPPSLQCTSLINDIMIAEAVLWFSSGGTRSVVHTDEFHNLNCVYSGSKHFILVDPAAYFGDEIPTHNVPGFLANLNADRVDFEEFPDLVDLEYYNVTVETGDCLFLPAIWIHQVNSFNRSFAVNVWFRTDAGDLLDFSTCLQADKFDPSITMDKVPRQGFVPNKDIVDAIREMLQGYTKDYGYMFYNEFKTAILMDHSGHLSKETNKAYEVPMKKMFQCIDRNVDDTMTHDEYNEATDEDWINFARSFHDLRAVLRGMFLNRPDVFNNFFEYPSEDADQYVQHLTTGDQSSVENMESKTGQSSDGNDLDVDFKDEL